MIREGPYWFGDLNSLQLGAIALPGTTSMESGTLAAGINHTKLSRNLFEEADQVVMVEEGVLVIRKDTAIFLNASLGEKGRRTFCPDYPLERVAYSPTLKALVAVGGGLVHTYHPSRLNLLSFYEIGNHDWVILDNGDVCSREGVWLSAADRYQPTMNLVTTGRGHATQITSLGSLVRFERGQQCRWYVARRDQLPMALVTLRLNGGLNDPAIYGLLGDLSMAEIQAKLAPLNLPFDYAPLVEAGRDCLLSQAPSLTSCAWHLRLALQRDLQEGEGEEGERELLGRLADFLLAWNSSNISNATIISNFSNLRLPLDRPLLLACWRGVALLVERLEELSKAPGKPRLLTAHWRALRKRVGDLLGKLDPVQIIASLELS